MASFLATKSVSQLTDNKIPAVLSLLTLPKQPLLKILYQHDRKLFFALFSKIFNSLLKIALASTNAFLQSIIPVLKIYVIY